MSVKDLFAIICHQLKSRSYVICGKGMYICARCTGIFTGFFATSILLFFLYGFFHAGLRFFYVLLLFVPLFLDGMTQLLGMRRSNNALRLFTGYLTGMGSAFTFHFIFTLTLHHTRAAVLPSRLSLLSLAIFALLWGVLEYFDHTHNKYADAFFKILITVAVLSFYLMGFAALVSLFFI